MKTTQKEILSVLHSIKDVFYQRGIVRLGLFGSFAKSEEGAYSDIDIAIAKAPDYLQKFDAYDYFETLNDLRRIIRQKLHRPVDIFDLDSKSPLKSKIEKELIDV